jgi:hypothetical protein
MRALVTLGFTLLVTSYLINNPVMAGQNASAIQPSQQSIQFFKKQVGGGSSISNTLKSLLDRYPQRTSEFVSIAFTAYPERYREIITASVSAKPMFVDEIIILANKHRVAKPTEIVALAVSAEPSYAGVATSAACKLSPEYFSEIVRTAVTAEPDSADQIAQKLVAAFPSKTMEILITTIKEVPFVGKYVLDALLATVVDDDVKSEDMIIVSVEQLAQYPDAIERLVQLAEQRDIDSERVRLSAIKGGLSEKAIVAVINEHYSTLEQLDEEPNQ